MPVTDEDIASLLCDAVAIIDNVLPVTGSPELTIEDTLNMRAAALPVVLTTLLGRQ
jgi:hypothetical protein